MECGILSRATEFACFCGIPVFTEFCRIHYCPW